MYTESNAPPEHLPLPLSASGSGGVKVVEAVLTAVQVWSLFDPDI